MKYEEFLESKAIIDPPTGIPNPKGISKNLFPFQSPLVQWALRRGRAALFEHTGLGKSPQQCEYARIVEAHTKKPVLILAPLAVSHQTIGEAEKILGMEIKFASDDSDIRDRGVYITNYAKLARFDGLQFGGMVADESSVVKSQGSKTLELMTEQFSKTPFRLCCTATPSPNSFTELGQHAEFLGVMTMNEMLSTFFVHDGGETQQWRLKGHAEKDFWKWLASWSVCITKPSDIGFKDDGYILPKLNMVEVVVAGETSSEFLFPMEALTLNEQRQSRRDSMQERLAKVIELTNSNDEQWLIWSNLNEESQAIAKAVNDCEEVSGSDDDDTKERLLLGFSTGSVKRLSTKSSIAGFGMNWQKCHNMIFFGISHSFEAMYQAIRRCWRFGQKEQVNVYIIMSESDGAILRNIKRKQADAERMQVEMARFMSDITKKQLGVGVRTKTGYEPKKEMTLPDWIFTQP